MHQTQTPQLLSKPHSASHKKPPDVSGRRQAEAAEVSPSPGRWWTPLLEGGSREQLLSTKDGTPLRILEAEDLKKGAVIELTNATDLESGPDDPSPAEQRIFIVTCNGEHYLETTAPGEDESLISTHM